MALSAQSATPRAHSYRVRRTMRSWRRKHWHWCSESNASTSSCMGESSPCSRTISHSPPSWVHTTASPPSQLHACKGGLSSCLRTLMRSVADAQKSMPMQTVCPVCTELLPWAWMICCSNLLLSGPGSCPSRYSSQAEWMFMAGSFSESCDAVYTQRLACHSSYRAEVVWCGGLEWVQT